MKQQNINEDFTQLIKEHQGIIHKICNIYGNTNCSFDDLRQEIILQLWKSKDSFKGLSKPSTWVYKVALNTALSIKRKSFRQVNTTLFTLRDFDQPYDEEEIEKTEKFEFLYKAIRALPEVQRAIIIMYLEGNSYIEISEITGIPASQVGVKIMRIKQKLEKEFSKLFK